MGPPPQGGWGMGVGDVHVQDTLFIGQVPAIRQAPAIRQVHFTGPIPFIRQVPLIRQVFSMRPLKHLSIL